FLTSNKVWFATDRSRARRCVEACVYGTLDFVGYPRFPAPVEFIAAVIAYYVHPVNIQTACLIMVGDLCLVLLLAVLLLLLLVAPCLNCLEAVKKPPPVAFKVMCLLPITIL